ncbi:MAG TPA: hypothetical protein VM677_14740 [Actinokineospora sp.]|jgi:hypothetical protein|nr:hypothetical protein [Actinokineospora sp.]
METRRRLFAGDPEHAERGVWANVTHERGRGLNDGSEEVFFRRDEEAHFRVVPLLRVLGEPGSRRITVGQVVVSVAADSEPEVTVLVHAAWVEDNGWNRAADPLTLVDDVHAGSFTNPAHTVPDGPAAMATVIAKAVAESSRNAVARVRGLRYELEIRLSEHLDMRREESVRSVLRDLIELSLAVDGARDQAREAAREVMWVWLNDDTAYRAARDAEPSDAPWMPTLRAGLRQCEAMDAQLKEESEQLSRLLNSMSTIAVAHEAESIQRFNLFATAAAAGIGLPALILAFYGAQPYLPLDSFSRTWRALLPVVLTSILAVSLVLFRLPGKPKTLHILAAVVVVMILCGVLFLAGALVPH